MNRFVSMPQSGTSPVLVLGGDGQLGSAIRAAFDASAVVAPTRAAFDIVTGDADALVRTLQPRTVINCAAFHDVDRCEREPDPAFAANALAVDRLAAASAQAGATFVTISTDYVFSGDARQPYAEGDATQPRTVYGMSKVAGELLTRRHGPKHLIVRTSGVFGPTGRTSKGPTLIARVLAQAERGEPTRMVDDVTFSPSYAPHVARAIHDLVEAGAYGTHHVTNAGACTWYAFVRAAFELAGLGDAPLEPIGYASLGNPTPRPRYSPLTNTTFAAAGIAPLPTWTEALREYLGQRTR